MMTKLIAAWPLEGYEVWLAFADGTEGPVDLREQMPRLRPAAPGELGDLRRLRVDRVRNSLVWPGGPTLDTTLLYRSLRRRSRRL